MSLLLSPAAHRVDDSTRRGFLVGAAALSALVLLGCGDDGGTSGAGEARDVEDAFGPTQVPATPERVIADSVSTYAHLVSLGITPVAVALPEGISPDYISDEADDVANVVADDGWTVDVEQALALRPDLVVAVGADYNLENCERYRQAVATYCFTDVYETGTDQDVKDTLVGLALALGREDEAAAAIARYDARLAELRDRVAATDLPGRRVGIVRFDAAGFVGIRTEHPGNGVLTSLGVPQPDWPPADHDGYVVLSLETLELLDRADVLLVNTDDDVVVEELEVLRSPLWAQLALVREDRARFVSAWNGGDLPQLHRILDDLEAALVVPAESGR